MFMREKFFLEKRTETGFLGRENWQIKDLKSFADSATAAG